MAYNAAYSSYLRYDYEYSVSEGLDDDLGVMSSEFAWNGLSCRDGIFTVRRRGRAGLLLLWWYGVWCTRQVQIREIQESRHFRDEGCGQESEQPSLFLATNSQIVMAPMRPTPALVVTPITPTKPKFVPSGPASTPDLQSSFVEQDPFNSLSPSPSNNNLFALRKRRSHLQVLNQEGGGGDTDNVAQKMGNREKEDGDDTSEMLRWGWIMLVGSTLSFIVGVWSIAVGPFLDTKGFLVSNTAGSIKQGHPGNELNPANLS